MLTELEVLNGVTRSLETQLGKLDGDTTSRKRVLLWLSSWVADQLGEAEKAAEQISS